MKLGDPSVLETSSGEAAAAGKEPVVTVAPEGGEAIGESGGGGGGDEVDNKINFGGNRWPRQETLALLKIRSDMDAVFRDSSLKGPLWEEVSRKLANLGYQRSAKKCKEKFENVYKYHKRTKESRSGKSEGKTYKFFDELQALENQFTVSSSYPPEPQPTTTTTTFATNTLTLLPTTPIQPIPCAITTVPSTKPTVLIPPSPSTTITSTTVATNPRNPPSSQPPNNNNIHKNVSYSLPNMNLFSSTSTSSSTASDDNLEGNYGKKRKWKEYFRRLTRQVLTKQEEMQMRFLEAIDKREREQVAQQDAWRMQEMARINREHEILVQERSTAAAKDAAVIAFLQKLSGLQSPITTTQVATTITFDGNFHPQPPQLQPPPPPPSVSKVQPQPKPQQLPPAPLEIMKVNDNGINNGGGPLLSPSRWPKAEVHALIRLRTSLEAKYQENGPKAPLWEDISAGMQRLGYNRSAKRCKEKWENINKYFKRVKESKKQRREDSKTCPYFHELDAIYKEKSKYQNLFGSSFHNMKTNEMMEPLMVQPEQQWRPPPQYEQHDQMEDDSNNNNNNKEREAQGDYDDEDDDEEVDDNGEDEVGDSVEDERGNSLYEIKTNKLSSVDAVE